MSELDIPPELRDRLRAYLEDVAPAGQVDELETEVHQQLARRSTRQPAQVMAIAHETVSSRIRITPEAAAAALVDHGGLSPMVAQHIVGLPVDGVVGGTPVGPIEPGEPEAPTEPTQADEAEPVVEGWDDFWSPPTEEASPASAPEASTDEAAAETDAPARTPEARAPVVVRPDAPDVPSGPPVAARPSGSFQTWTSGARPTRGVSGALIAVAVAVGVVVLVVAGLLAMGGDDEDGRPAAVGEPTPTDTAGAGGVDAPDTADPDTTDPATTGPDGTEPTSGTTDTGAITVTDAHVVAADGGDLRAGGSALLSLTIGGTGNAPATVQWQLERDGEPVFPPAPLVVPADGDVRLTIPPALLADAGAYLVRVSQDGAVLLERDFEVTG